MHQVRGMQYGRIRCKMKAGSGGIKIITYLQQGRVRMIAWQNGIHIRFIKFVVKCGISVHCNRDVTRKSCSKKLTNQKESHLENFHYKELICCQLKRKEQVRIRSNPHLS